ncbi:unnamed protein product [Rotaria sp. Silwood2]|nr:unnamed protein product [Rotaria sp. Silwood2]CAF3037753.1 unnamed protein product [Rotaria sp. Silwood2]CAF4220124.1 unnamed protein product [Rotaria sp. Silwood2]CAF4371224.1 unnamed protein product [Rotaria sp. Silwood2]
MIDNNSERSITLEFNKNDEINRVQASTLTFKSINYYLNIQKCCNICQLPCLKKTQKQILIDLSGIFQGGMNAIMGPTGSGKSSLLDLLADRKDRQGFQGEILLNGQLQSKDYKYHAGYVVQDDIVSGNLTIKENLMFSANVRLSTKLTSNEKNKIVDEVIVQLGLEKCANTRIGTDFKRGVSGGERKRTNIGMELVLSPMVLFLDEPTTGLDSSMARNVMECLHRLSRKGRTIIFSIHQPRYSIFKLFDTLFLIATGRCIYHGPTDNVLQFFSSVGFSCEEHDNPADFILDVLQSDRFSPLTNDQTDNDLDKQNNQIEFYLNKEYMKTDIFSSIQNKITEKNYLSNGNNNEHIRLEEKSRLNHIFYLSQRTLRNSFRDPSLAILQTVLSIFLGIIIGLIYLHINRTIDTGAKNRSGAIFFIVTNQVFSNLSALELFIKERILFVHENVSGYYHVLTYFLSKIICDIIPLRTIPAIAFSIIVYFMMGFQRTVEKFFIFFFCIWLTSICASSLCFLVSATVRNFGVANLVAALFCVLTLVFGGFLVEISSVLSFLQWIQYFSIFRYGSNALLINEFIGLTLCLPNNTNICVKDGTEVLTELHVEHSTNWDLWKNFVALISITIGFLSLAYVQLRRIKNK